MAAMYVTQSSAGCRHLECAFCSLAMSLAALVGPDGGVEPSLGLTAHLGSLYTVLYLSDWPGSPERCPG